MTPKEKRLYRAIGGRLAVVLRQRHGETSSTASLQAIAADLVEDQTDLLLPLKDLVSRPGFQLLVGKAGSGSGMVERRALLADLERTFSPLVITALEELLGGFLDLPMSSGSAPSEMRTEPRSVPGEKERANQRQRGRTAPPQDTLAEVNPRIPTRVGGSVALALGMCVATATLLLSGLAVIRNPLICSMLGICTNSGSSTAVQHTFDAARRAVTDLENATSLESYRSAAKTLENELHRLPSENLTSEQRQQEQKLAAISRKANAAVLRDETDLEHLEQARLAVDAARSLQGNEQQVQLAAAEQALYSIYPGGFAALEATRLRGEIGTLKRQQQAGAEELVEEGQPQAGAWPEVPTNPRPAVGSAPAAPKPVTPPPKVSPGGQWRDKPLF